MIENCISFDCIGILGLTCEDTWKVFQCCKEYDKRDATSRKYQKPPIHNQPYQKIRIGYPRNENLLFFGDTSGKFQSFDDSKNFLSGLLDVEFVPIDWSPFCNVSRFLFEGPWVAERLASFIDFYEQNKEGILPIIRDFFERGNLNFNYF